MELIERLRRAESEDELAAIEHELGLQNFVDTIQQVADWWGVHANTVGAWLKKGCPGSHGKFDLREIAKWRVIRNEGRQTEDESVRELIRKQQAIKAERDQMKLDYDKGRLIARDQVLADVTSAFAMVRLRLEALPAEMVVNESADVRDAKLSEWRDRIRMVLKELEAVAHDR